MSTMDKYRLLSALQDEMTVELTWEASQAAYGFLVGKYNYTVLRFLTGIVTIY